MDGINQRMSTSIFGIPMGPAAALQSMNQATAALGEYAATEQSKTPEGQTQLSIMEQLAAFFRNAFKIVNKAETGQLTDVMTAFGDNVKQLSRIA